MSNKQEQASPVELHAGVDARLRMLQETQPVSDSNAGDLPNLVTVCLALNGAARSTARDLEKQKSRFAHAKTMALAVSVALLIVTGFTWIQIPTAARAAAQTEAADAARAYVEDEYGVAAMQDELGELLKAARERKASIETLETRLISRIESIDAVQWSALDLGPRWMNQIDEDGRGPWNQTSYRDYDIPAFGVFPDGTVRLRGTTVLSAENLRDASNLKYPTKLIASLPLSHAPKVRMSFPVLAGMFEPGKEVQREGSRELSHHVARIDVMPDGSVVAVGKDRPYWLALNSISFRPAESDPILLDDRTPTDPMYGRGDYFHDTSASDAPADGSDP